MKFTELENCPFCGCEEYFEKSRLTGYVQYFIRFDGEETDNSNMYDTTRTMPNGKVYCGECERYLGNYITDTLSAAAAKKVLRK